MSKQQQLTQTTQYKDLQLHQKALYDRLERYFHKTSITIEDYSLVVSLLSDKYQRLVNSNTYKEI